MNSSLSPLNTWIRCLTDSTLFLLLASFNASFTCSPKSTKMLVNVTRCVTSFVPAALTVSFFSGVKSEMNGCEKRSLAVARSYGFTYSRLGYKSQNPLICSFSFLLFSNKSLLICVHPLLAFFQNKN